MFPYILSFVLFLLSYFYHLRRRSRIHRHGQPLRRPDDTLPLLGNAIKFLQPRHVLFDWFTQCQTKFGLETFEISVPTLPPGVVISDPKNLEFVLKNEASITKGEFFKRRSWDLFGYGIINANGELWKTQRKAGLKFFSGANLDILIDEALPEAYKEMNTQLLKDDEQNLQTDLQELFQNLTTKVVGQMAYDMDIDASSPFSKAFDYASDHIGLRFQNPLYPLTELFTGAKFQAAIAEVKAFGKMIVANARKRRSHEAFETLVTNEQLESDPTSLIDSLMEAFPNPTIVADAALNFLSAGRDTTAQSLTWTFYAMMRHPEVIPQLRKEIEAVFPSADISPQIIASSKLQPANIPFTYAVFYESLRLYPPVPFELKQCLEPITLPDGTFLPAFSVVVWCIWAMNRAVQTFGQDAHLFRPWRWIDTNGKLAGKTAFEFPVFNGGPRACLGRKMAEFMGVWCIVRLALEWDFDEVGGDEGERVSRNSLTLPMHGGLPCRARRREKSGTGEPQAESISREVGKQGG